MGLQTRFIFFTLDFNKFLTIEYILKIIYTEIVFFLIQNILSGFKIYVYNDRQKYGKNSFKIQVLIIKKKSQRHPLIVFYSFFALKRKYTGFAKN